MSRVFDRLVFSAENVSKVSTTPCTLDLYPLSVLIGHFFYSSGDHVVKTRPSRSRIEFRIGGKEAIPTTSAGIGALGFMIEIMTREWRFRSTLLNYFGLCRR